MAEPRPRVWVSQPLFDDILARLEAHFEVARTSEVANHDSAAIAASLRDADGALVTLNDRIGAAEITGAGRLRAIANVAVGYDNLDVAALQARGIIATNTPDVLTETTADLGFALMMAAARRIGEAERWLRGGHWRQWAFTTMLGADVHGSTLGILGMGRIGQAIARRAIGFGMRTVYHNRNRLPEAVERDCRAGYVSFDELLAQADHLLLVLPYAAENHHIVDAAALARMKPGATLVNIARGGLVDEDALADALAAGRLAAAGLDVFEHEPQINPRLLSLPNVILTPHIGSGSVATRRAMVAMAVDNLIAALGFGPDAGRPPNPVVPTEALSTQAVPIAGVSPTSDASRRMRSSHRGRR